MVEGNIFDLYFNNSEIDWGLYFNNSEIDWGFEWFDPENIFPLLCWV